MHFLGRDLGGSGQEAQGNMGGWGFVKLGLNFFFKLIYGLNKLFASEMRD